MLFAFLLFNSDLDKETRLSNDLSLRTSSSVYAATTDAAATAATAAVAAADHHVGGAHLGASCDWKREIVAQLSNSYHISYL